ncbi:MAG: hypothetical protein HQM08_04835 [Candidatus Riflebacteria bacterium]|nr:hypothetical protein [Candidatus Riflebacteria bacterium]
MKKLIVSLLFVFLSSNLLFAQFTSSYIRETVIGLARNSANLGIFPDIGPFVNYVPPEVAASMKKLKIKGSRLQGNIKFIVGGRNFTAADVDSAAIPFYTKNGLGLTDLYHDGGEWPNSGGNITTDSGQPAAGVDWNGEFYDLDKNGHYPKAVLRFIGSHCYIFVPTMFFPTLPRGISATEDQTPAPKSEWGMYWPDTAGGEKIYYAPATGAKSIDPRFILGADKNLARIKLQELADEFDGNIYPKMREWFGEEPDVDQDPKIYILLDDIQDGLGQFLGYFWAGNELPRSQISTSNEKELLYIDLFPNYVNNPQRVYGTIAHEFVHMIHYNMGNQDEERWLEEAFTQYGTYIYNQTHTSNLDEFIKNPNTILVDPRLDTWLGSNPFANYGASYLFMFYLIEHYAKNNGPTFMRNLVSDKNGTGIIKINDSLKPLNTTFDQVFSDWAIANYIDKTRKLDMSPLNDGKWGYAVDNDTDQSNDLGVAQHLPVKFTERVILTPQGTARSSSVNPWAANYIEVSGSTGNLSVGFDGSDGVTFKAGVIKRGPQVDPAVEYLYLDDKQAGNLLIQNYGAGSTYENLVLVPMVVSSGNYEKQNYVYSATFSDLKLAIFPHPIFENELQIVVRTTDKFAATPRLQMTYNSEQGYLVMTPISDSVYITNYRLAASGEGTVSAFGTNSNGTILSNLLKFSAVYYPAKSQGQLSASFANLRIPEGALNKANWITMSSGNSGVSFAGIQPISQSVQVSVGEDKFEKPVQISIPLKTGLKNVFDKVGLFEINDNKAFFLGSCKVEGSVAQGEITKPSEVFVGIDNVPPVIAEKVESEAGKIQITAKDSGSGIDESSVEVACDGCRVPAKFNSLSGKIEVDSSSLKDGNVDLDVKVQDRLGNIASSKITAQVVSGFSIQEATAYPNPARDWAKFRCSFKGSISSVYSIDVCVRDMRGDEVYDTTLSYRGDGAFEAQWNLKNNDGKKVANGVYFAIFQISTSTGESKIRKKIVVLR